MTREPLYAIVYTADGLAVVPAVEVPRRAALGKRVHMAKTLAELLAHPPALKASTAEQLLEKLTVDPVEVTVREPFGPEGHRV